MMLRLGRYRFTVGCIFAGLARFAIIMVFPLSLDQAAAQNAPGGSTADALERALAEHGGTEPENNQTLRPTIQTFQPVPATSDAPGSRLEQLFSIRANRTMTQFGYDIFGVPATVSLAQTGAVQDSYVLGQGDELVVVYRGQENATYRQRIDREGRVILPKLQPIAAAGRTFGEFRRDLELQVSRSFISTSVFVSLGEVRQLSVLVAGEVRSPGMRILNSLSTPLDAILLSGGINKTGSLRHVQLIRSGAIRTIDLYSVLTRGVTSLGQLRDGDRIYVPPLGRTVGIAGYVRRPGIYELASSDAMNSDALIRLAGGTEIAGAYDLSKTLLQRDGRSQLVPLVRNGLVRSGEILFVDPSQNTTFGYITPMGTGATRGDIPLTSARTVGVLIRGMGGIGGLQSGETYGLFGLIARRDPVSNSVVLLPFSVARVLRGGADIPLQDNDKVYFLSRARADTLTRLATRTISRTEAGGLKYDDTTSDAHGTQSPAVAETGPLAAQNLLSPNSQPIANNDQNPANDNLAPMNNNRAPANNNRAPTNDSLLGGGRTDQNNVRPNTVLSVASAEANAVEQKELGGNSATTKPEAEIDQAVALDIASSLRVPLRVLVRTAHDNIVWVTDTVSNPGPYLAADGTTLAEIIQAAGGVLQQADLSSIEVTSSQIDQQTGISTTTRFNYAVKTDDLTRIVVKSQDVVRLRSVYSDREEGTVTLSGQVRFPGVFNITRAEHLSSVLERAGGLTEVAYPYGAIFTRREAAVAEKTGNEREAKEIEEQLSLLTAEKGPGQTGPSDLGYISSLAQRLRDTPALGRVMVVADPAILAASPQLDILLTPGDSIYIPKRPSSISVTGEVLNPGSFIFRSDLGVDDYIQLAGGVKESSEEGRVFVVLPDGSARPVGGSWLTFQKGMTVPPGSSIVVPRDLSPFNWTDFLKNASQIISQLAITAASLAVLRSN